MTSSRPATVPSVTVASVPRSHVYVSHIGALDDRHTVVKRLPDPDPDHPTRSTVEKWWPPVMLQPDWIRHAHYDLLHIHFGFDGTDPAELRDVLRLAHATGAPIVYTAHDLRNPHHTDSRIHDRQLAVLMDHADAVVTLTHGAATEIRQRWGRDALVIPHPHVVDLPTMQAHHDARRVTTPPREFRIGVHVKSLRANMDPQAILPVLEEAVAQLPGAVLQVNGHRDVLESPRDPRHAALATHLRRAHERGRLELHIHDFFDDTSLWRYLAGLDVSVLPYRFGTHSGWLEACRDLGTTVVAPTCGYYADQGPVLSYSMDEDHVDPDTLHAAIVAAYTERPDLSADVESRRQERLIIADAHESLYQRLLT